eukprot:6199897-Pleurochrysis_carterae.AAC.2
MGCGEDTASQSALSDHSQTIPAAACSDANSSVQRTSYLQFAKLNLQFEIVLRVCVLSAF